ncbi:MAG TPA: cupin domain-containing protein [Kofleriaceae bacterium]|nr:cupin domain-containing protein [Kofleriaceae bacterium]
MTTPRILERLFPDLAAGEFARDVYPVRACAAHGPPERLGDLASWPAWDDPAALVECIGGEVVIGYTREEDGSPSQAVHPRQHWRRLYDSGATVELLASTQPRLRALCDDVAVELGLAGQAVSADVFLSPRGEAVPKHFDGVDVIVVQLRGTKRWQIAPNSSLRFPAHAYIAGFGPDIRNSRDVSEDGAASHDLEMPEGAETIDLEPGSALFVPRGWWHCTSALRDSVSISIVTRPPTTGDLLRALVDRNILTRPEWREPVALAAADATAIRGRLSALVSDLGGQASRVPLERAQPARHYRRCDGVDIAVIGDRDDHSIVTIRRCAAGSTRIRVPGYVASLFAWVATRHATFRSLDAAPLFPPGSADWIESELRTLETMRVVEPA